MDPLDDPSRHAEVAARIASKPALTAFYREIYGRFAACLARCPPDGLAVELGAGAGFARAHVPGLVSADLLPYPGLDLVADGCHLPFADGTLRMLCMVNVFHHIPDAAAFLAEARRCLRPGGRLFLVDQHPGWIAGPVLRHLHHEPFDDRADWAFPSSGPLSGANGAQAWIVFVRDRQRLAAEFPELTLVGYTPHSPLRYWLTGGLKRWCLLPGAAFGAATRLDRALVRRSPQWGSFVDIELVRQRAFPAGPDALPVREHASGIGRDASRIRPDASPIQEDRP